MYSPCHCKHNDPDFWAPIIVLNHRNGTLSTRIIKAYGGAYSGCMSWEVTSDIVSETTDRENNQKIYLDDQGQQHIVHLSRYGLEGFGADLVSIYNKSLEPIDRFARLSTVI